VLTQTSLVLGSPVYMSPEQLRSPKDVDTRTDIWALGSILWELMLGKPPFFADSITALTAKVLLESLPPPDPKAKLPKNLDAVLRRALTKDRAQRYGTIAEFVQALLPFAPARSRDLAERIVRLQQTASATQADTLAKGLAPPERQLLTGTRPLGTPASWGSTVAAAVNLSRRRRIVWAAAGSLLLGAIATLLMVSNGSKAEPSGHPAGRAASAAQAQSKPARAEPNARQPEQPARSPAPAEAPADEPEEVTDAGAPRSDARPAADAGASVPRRRPVVSWRPRRPAAPPKPTPKKTTTGWESYGDRK